MDRGSWLFWSLIAVLVGASVFFGLNAEQRRRSVQHGSSQVDNGEVVTLIRVIDGDTVLVRTPRDETAAVRVLGIKAFPTQPEKDPAARFGKAAVEALQAILKEKPIRVVLNSEPTDARGRTLATLYVGEMDVGEALVKDGNALVYTLYPFPAMAAYLDEQEAARAAGAGFWGDAEVATRADLLLKEWRRQTQ